MTVRACFLFLATPLTIWRRGAADVGNDRVVFSAPLFIVALSGPLLKEKAGIGGWLAVLFGFAGAVIVTQPGADTFEPAALFALASAAFYGIAQIMSRLLGATATTSVLALYQNTVNFIGALAIGLVFGQGDFAGQGHPSPRVPAARLGHAQHLRPADHRSPA
jgi:drug/metabolite transporter (DMT)-like permease